MIKRRREKEREDYVGFCKLNLRQHSSTCRQARQFQPFLSLPL
jgi:hypothetical protein